MITDGINISTVDLQRSRRAMSVITQNPVLFTSSLRMNLDPFEEHDNRDLWNALEKSEFEEHGGNVAATVTQGDLRMRSKL